MEIGFKDSNEQKKCSYEIRSVFVKSFEDIKKLFTEKRLLLGRFALNDDEVEKLLNLIKSKVSFEIDFIGKEDTYIVLDLDRGWCSISYVDLLYNGKVYKFEADRYRTSVGIRKYITTSEKIEKREQLETDYAIIKDAFGRQALVKFVDGDRRVFSEKRYIKKEFIDGKDENGIKLLYKLNPDGLQSGT